MADIIMFEIEPAYNRLPLAEIAQRLVAFVIDFLICLFTEQLLQEILGLRSNWLGLFIFALMWFFVRVLLASNNKGQSFGHWAFSLKVVDAEFGKAAGTFELFKRELTIFILVALLLGSGATTLILFALLPIGVDIAFAVADSRSRQTLHDKIGGTIVILSKNGFQLDRKFSKLFGQISRSSQQAYRSVSRNRDRYQERYMDQDSYEPRSRSKYQSDPYADRYEPRRSRNRYLEEYQDSYSEDQGRSSTPPRGKRPRKRRP